MFWKEPQLPVVQRCAEDRLDPTGTVFGQGRCARVVQRQMRGSMVLQTVVLPQLQSIDGRRYPFRTAESDPHGPGWSEDRRVSSVATRCQVVDAPVVQVVFHARCRVRRMVQTLQNSVEVPELQFLHGCGRRCDTQRRVPGSPGGASDSFIDGMFKF